MGYDKDNFLELKREIIKKQNIILYGNKNKPANVIVGWKEKNNKTWLTSAYVKEVDN